LLVAVGCKHPDSWDDNQRDTDRVPLQLKLTTVSLREIMLQSAAATGNSPTAGGAKLAIVRQGAAASATTKPMFL
jgi:hypothetical protein